MIIYPFQTSYKKSVGKNFMIIEPEDLNTQDTLNTESFRTRMIHENIIPGLLNTHVQYIDESPSFQYDITGMQSLEVILDTTPLTYAFLCKIFLSLYNALLSMENYMLLHDHILLSPEYIYMAADFSEVRLCYCPLKTDSMTDSIRSFFDYLLKKVDHSDEKCVYLAYSMHRCCNDIDFSLTKLYSKLSTVPDDSKSCQTIYDTPLKATKTNISTTVFSESYSANNCTINESEVHEEAEMYADVFLKKDNGIFIKKTAQFLILLLVVICAFTFLYVRSFFNFEFYILLLFCTIIVGIYNTYHIHRQYGRTKLEAVASSNSKSCYNKPSHNYIDSNDNVHIDTSTVMLTSHADINSHKLIYTGTGDEIDITLTHFPFVIGKTDNCSAILKNSAISRLHAKLSLSHINDDYANADEDIFIEDLNSTNGTLLNNKPLIPYEKYPINSGDYITFGHLTYIFR